MHRFIVVIVSLLLFSCASPPPPAPLIPVMEVTLPSQIAGSIKTEPASRRTFAPLVGKADIACRSRLVTNLLDSRKDIFYTKYPESAGSFTIVIHHLDPDHARLYDLLVTSGYQVRFLSHIKVLCVDDHLLGLRRSSTRLHRP